MACGEAQNPLGQDRMTQKMTSGVGNALPYAMTYDMITGKITLMYVGHVQTNQSLEACVVIGVQCLGESHVLCQASLKC